MERTRDIYVCAYMRIPPLSHLVWMGTEFQSLTTTSHLSLSCLQVPEIVSVLRAKLRDTQEEHVLPAAQHSVYLLASQHCEAVVSSLLGSPLPFDRYSVP